MKGIIRYFKSLHIHNWEYLGEFGFVYQQKRCKICGRLKIVNQQ